MTIYSDHLKYLDELENFGKGSGSVPRTQQSGWNNATQINYSGGTAPTTSGNAYQGITQREIDVPDSGGSGGGGGMDMMSSFTDLGDKIQKNSMAVIDQAQRMKGEDRDRRRQARLDREAKRQFDKNYGLLSRDRNMNAMDYLANIRGAAGQNASTRLPFRTAMARSIY